MSLRELRTHSNPEAKVFLMGNKINLEKDRKIKKKKGNQFCEDNKINGFIKASVKAEKKHKIFL